MPAIEVTNLTKSYGALTAVDDISFEVREGQVFAFLGPNGAGKTTTVEILEGYRPRTSGTVSVLGQDPAKSSRAFRSRIGIVLQECGFPRFATVRELLSLQAGYYPDPRPVDEVLEIVGLTDKANQVIRSLSGGQARRLDFALALVGNPDLIFLDEPTTGFDPSARRDSWETIRNLRDLGKTIFLTTHYMDEAQRLADHVVVLASGRIAASGPPGSLGGRNTARTTISFRVDASLPQLRNVDPQTADGRVTLLTDQPTEVLHELTSWAVSERHELQELEVSRPSLEDIYLQLTQGKQESA